MGSEVPEPDLLPGEGGVPAPGDAEHWVGVYQELVEFCERLREEHEPNQPERALLARRLRHYRQRLLYWRSLCSGER